MQLSRNALHVALKHIHGDFLSVTGSKNLSLHNGNRWLFEMEMPYTRWIVILLDAQRFMFVHWELRLKEQQLNVFE